VALNINTIPDSIGYYLSGFTDGEGSFNLSFRKRSDYKMPWKISLCFNVSQKDEVILLSFKEYLQCGALRKRSDGVWYYEVNNFADIVENVIPFFNKFGFLSDKKKKDFVKFKQLAKLIYERKHLTKEGIEEILAIRETMNNGGVGKRKYSPYTIMSCFDLKKSSETIRQAP